MSRCMYCGGDDHGTNQCPDMPPPVIPTDAQSVGMREALIASGCTASDGTYVHASMEDVLRALAAQPPAATVETDDITAALNARQAAINEGMARPKSSAGNVRDVLLNAIDSPTVAALAGVFNPRNTQSVLSKSYCEQIVEILEPRLRDVPQAAKVPVEDPELCWHTDQETEGELVVTQYELAATRTALEPFAKISLWRDSYPDAKEDNLTARQLQGHIKVEDVRRARAALALSRPHLVRGDK